MQTNEELFAPTSVKIKAESEAVRRAFGLEKVPNGFLETVEKATEVFIKRFQQGSKAITKALTKAFPEASPALDGPNRLEIAFQKSGNDIKLCIDVGKAYEASEQSVALSLSGYFRLAGMGDEEARKIGYIAMGLCTSSLASATTVQNICRVISKIGAVELLPDDVPEDLGQVEEYFDQEDFDVLLGELLRQTAKIDPRRIEYTATPSGCLVVQPVPHLQLNFHESVESFIQSLTEEAPGVMREAFISNAKMLGTPAGACKIYARAIEQKIFQTGLYVKAKAFTLPGPRHSAPHLPYTSTTKKHENRPDLIPIAFYRKLDFACLPYLTQMVQQSSSRYSDYPNLYKKILSGVDIGRIPSEAVWAFKLDFPEFSGTDDFVISQDRAKQLLALRQNMLMLRLADEEEISDHVFSEAIRLAGSPTSNCLVRGLGKHSSAALIFQYGCQVNGVACLVDIESARAFLRFRMGYYLINFSEVQESAHTTINQYLQHFETAVFHGLTLTSGPPRTGVITINRPKIESTDIQELIQASKIQSTVSFLLISASQSITIEDLTMALTVAALESGAHQWVDCFNIRIKRVGSLNTVLFSPPKKSTEVLGLASDIAALTKWIQARKPQTTQIAVQVCDSLINQQQLETLAEHVGALEIRCVQTWLLISGLRVEDSQV